MAKWLLLAILAVGPILQLTAQNTPRTYIITGDTATQQFLDNSYWQVLNDKSGTFTVDDVQKEPLSNQFIYFTKNSKDSFAKTTWFRFNIENNAGRPLHLSIASDAAEADFFIPDSNGVFHHFLTGKEITWNKKDGFKIDNAIPLEIKQGEQKMIYLKTVNRRSFVSFALEFSLFNTQKLTETLLKDYQDSYTKSSGFFSLILCGIFLLAGIFNLLLYFSVRERGYLYFFIFSLFACLSYAHPLYDVKYVNILLSQALGTIQYLWAFFLLQFVRHYLQVSKYRPRWNKWLLIISGLFLTYIIISILLFLISQYVLIKNSTYIPFSILAYIIDNTFWLSFIITIILFLQKRRGDNRIFLIGVIPFAISILAYTLLQLSAIFIASVRSNIAGGDYTNFFGYLNGVGALWLTAVISWVLFKKYALQEKAITQEKLEKEQLAKEKEIQKRELIAQQKIQLEKEVKERTSELKQSLDDLKATQSQLIQSEKMASLGELTAGIAHEIQNPLNFVNNFSEVNNEMIDELKAEIDKGNYDDAKMIADDIKSNEEKINHHGKRADAIVKGMLQHSRSSTGIKEPSDINALAAEYLRLAYQSNKAKDKSFNATMKTDFDESVGKISIIPQDMGRVLLNLYHNAFYAVHEKQKACQAEPAETGYQPTVTVSTKKINDKAEIIVADNGNGIPQKVVDKIFQPFFTTKPTGQGTGLGLSLSYDIVKAHGGEIKVETKEGEGSEFVIHFPIARITD